MTHDGYDAGSSKPVPRRAFLLRIYTDLSMGWGDEKLKKNPEFVRGGARVCIAKVHLCWRRTGEQTSGDGGLARCDQHGESENKQHTIERQHTSRINLSHLSEVLGQVLPLAFQRVPTRTKT